VPDGKPLRMWKGKWHPAVYHFSSNWKELATLKLSLIELMKAGQDQVQGVTIFYFTDNSSVYWISASGTSPSPGLHRLIEEIRLLELELDCSLQVIHVPGLLMILQGMDGLSRGIWMAPFHDLLDPTDITRAVFAPATYDATIVNSYVTQFGLGDWYQHHRWDQTWDARNCFDRLTVWFPPPEVARQLLIFLLETWAEKPTTTSALVYSPLFLVGPVSVFDGTSDDLSTLNSHSVPTFGSDTHLCSVLTPLSLFSTWPSKVGLASPERQVNMASATSRAAAWAAADLSLMTQLPPNVSSRRLGFGSRPRLGLARVIRRITVLASASALRSRPAAVTGRGSASLRWGSGPFSSANAAPFERF
jgi:hypothetical protein